MGECLASSLGLEGVLMRGSGNFNLGSELLGNGSSNESPEKLPVRLLESSDPPSPNGDHHLFRHLVSCQQRCGVAAASPCASNRGRTWSAVMPEGPGTVLRRALRTFAKKRSCAKMNSSTGANWEMSSGTQFLGWTSVGILQRF